MSAWENLSGRQVAGAIPGLFHSLCRFDRDNASVGKTKPHVEFRNACWHAFFRSLLTAKDDTLPWKHSSHRRSKSPYRQWWQPVNIIIEAHWGGRQ
jgi:hypothetical protein